MDLQQNKKKKKNYINSNYGLCKMNILKLSGGDQEPSPDLASKCRRKKMYTRYNLFTA